MDGVLYLGESPIPGAVETIDRLQKSRHKVYFLTNNSGKSRSDYREKLERLSIQTDDDHIFTSAYACALLLKSRGAAGKTAFVVGESGLIFELTSAGIAVVTEPDTVPYTQIDYVIAGIDRGFTYAKLRFAHIAIARGHAEFIATNRDATFPVEEGAIPGAGAIIASIATSTGVEPTVIGKPETHALEMLLAAAGERPENAVMIGDRLDTDIACGNRLGLRTVLVLTGVSRPEDTVGVVPDQIPTLIVGSVTRLLESEIWDSPQR